jgi:hypothetical protein
MPSNQTPPNVQNYEVGGVIIVLGGVDLGDIMSFSINPSQLDILEHYSARSGARKLDAQIVIQKRFSMRAKLDEIQTQLLAKYFMGHYSGNEIAVLSQPLASSNCLITWLSEEGTIFTYSHTYVEIRPVAEMNFGEFREWVGYEIEIEALEDVNAPPFLDGTIPSFGVIDVVGAG